MKENLLKEILFYSKLLHKNGLVSATDGNISVRKKGGFFITPSAFPKRELEKNQIVELDSQGNPAKGKPSSESKMHLAIYNAGKDINAIVHAHPPFTTALSLIDADFEKIPLSEFFISLQRVKTLCYVEPGSAELAKKVSALFRNPDVHAVILKNHGAVTTGNSLKGAYYRMEALEHSSKIYFMASVIGRPKSFDKDIINRLIEMGKKYGFK